MLIYYTMVLLLREIWLREKESNLHLRGQSPRCCQLHYPAMLVDPAGLKPAPHGLKGRRSVSRAPGQKIWLWRKDSNLRMAALTVRCLTNLATPQCWWLRVDSNHQPSAYETLALFRLSYTAD